MKNFDYGDGLYENFLKENINEKAIISIIKRIHPRCHRFVPGLKFGTNGIPDMAIFLPETFWLEIKINDTKITDLQKKFLEKASPMSGILRYKGGKLIYHGPRNEKIIEIIKKISISLREKGFDSAVEINEYIF